MMKINTVMDFLSLFGEEVEGGTMQDGSVSTPQTEAGEVKNESASVAGERDEAKRRREEFRALMEGEYKDQFTAYFQETFNRRFKEQKEMREELERNRALLGELTAHYGVAQEELLAAVKGQSALEREITPQTVAEIAPSPSREEIESELQRAVERAVAEARASTEQAMLASIRARGLRPAEGALSEVSADALRGRANSLSREQRAEVAKRAARGERIKF